MERISREQAVDDLARSILQQLSKERRQEILDEWGYEPGESGPSEDEFLLIGFRDSYLGVRNGYLADELEKLGLAGLEITGKPERLAACPCCSFRTLRARGEYYICPVCFWEDDGSDDPQHYSGPNHMTLATGRANFLKLGCSDGRSIGRCDPREKAKYVYGEGSAESTGNE